ncbi:hypothetical protein [Marinicrinis sediminis]|uniref:Uncharacterized protein n=1 Tax=Marinicrinis sediminis TaxID=1652465 RepID=A0ABW5RDG5_9BACL
MTESVETIRKQLRERQLERIHGMDCGREMDALIAQYIMGYQLIPMMDEDGRIEDYGYRRSASFTQRSTEDQLERVPNYSTVSYAAFQLLERFSHWQIDRQPSGIIIQLADGDSDMIQGATMKLTHRYAGLPEAICKAALSAVVRQNRLIEPLLHD